MMAQYLEIKAANPGCAAVLPDGRFLRAVLRGCRAAARGARHRADQARPARGRGHPDVRRAGACAPKHYLAQADPRAASRSRSASRSRIRPRPASAAARRWCGATWCASSPPGTLTEDGLLDARRAQLPGGGRRGGRRALRRSPGVDISTGEFVAASRSTRALAGRAGAARARRDPGRRSGCWRDRRCRAAGAMAGAALTPLPAAQLRQRRPASARLKQHLRGRRRSTASALSRGAEIAAAGALRRLCRADPAGRLPRLEPPRRRERRRAVMQIDAGDAAQSRADRTPGRRARRAACSPRSTAPSPAPARGCWPSGWRRR